MFAHILHDSDWSLKVRIVVKRRENDTLHTMAQFDTPKLAPGNTYDLIQIRKPSDTTSPVSRSAALRGGGDDPEFPMVLISLFISGSQPMEWLLLVDRASLVANMEFLQSLYADEGARKAISWEKWSVLVPTTLLGPFGPSFTAPTPAGNRVLIDEVREDEHTRERVGVLHSYSYLHGSHPPSGSANASHTHPAADSNTGRSPFVSPITNDIPLIKRTHSHRVVQGEYLFGSDHVDVVFAADATVSRDSVPSTYFSIHLTVTFTSQGLKNSIDPVLDIWEVS